MNADVVDATGRKVGHVREVRLTRGRRLRGPTTELKVSHLLVSTTNFGPSLGYDRTQVKGPWILAVVIRRFHRSDRVLEWDVVDRVEWSATGGRASVHLNITWAD